VKIHLQAALSGTSQLDLLPLAATQIHMQSPWSHPKFAGSNLPESRQVQDQGFKAAWNSAFMNESNQAYLQQCLSSAKIASSGFHTTEPIWQSAAIAVFQPSECLYLDRPCHQIRFIVCVDGVWHLRLV
jgi:inner membrane protein involved in colicin E2 resistance